MVESNSDFCDKIMNCKRRGIIEQPNNYILPKMDSDGFQTFVLCDEQIYIYILGTDFI